MTYNLRYAEVESKVQNMPTNELRAIALQQAISSSSAGEPTEATISRAEAYYAFLAAEERP